ncbi:TlpA family protein disulfide reductase [Patescibacteria group bacterium]|nr:TlpA family protein disulfide reductase [Patescibacteria group bacterium]MBU1957120.1 TlpA family protein disulfide reductase [bacterium]
MKKLLLTLALTFLSFTTLYAEALKPLTYTLTTTDGNTINITDTKEGLDFQEFKGKAVLLALFGHRCPPCIREIPEFIELTKKHKDDLAIVAIESQNYPLDEVKAFQKKHKMNYNVIAGINHNDFISYIAGRAGYTEGIPLPLLIAVDKHGEVQGLQAGQLSQDELELLVKKLNE